MTIDSRFFLAGDLQEYMVDKDTGLPLAGGILTFYRDSSRTDLKPVYELTGNPSNYNYIPLPNPLTLSGVGTIIDGSGNDVVPYYFPYDGNNQVGQSQGIVDLYYITCYSSGGVLQFIRQGWPNTAAGQTQASNITNYVPNGQFLIHTNKADGTVLLDPSGTTFITQGGWTFERPSTSTATDVITFPRFNSPVSTPSTYPRYAVEIKCSATSGDAFKRLGVRWDDVNKFASLTQKYTYGFTARSNSGVNFNVDLVLIKNFGTGGSPSATTETFLATFTITPSYGLFQSNFVFGVNDGSSIGTNDDDYVQLAIRVNPSATFDLLFTDFISTPGVVQLESFPVATTSDFLYKSIAGWMPVPAHDGSDIGLPLLLTKKGLIFDHSTVGDITSSGGSAVKKFGYLLCDGSQYETAAYDPTDGIPYSRLAAFLYKQNISQVPRYGTGTNFLTFQHNSVPVQKLIALTNNTGSATATFDVGTGFTFTTLKTGNNYGLTSFITFNAGAYNSVYIIGNNIGTAPTNIQDSLTIPTGFSFATIKNTNFSKPTFLVASINVPNPGSWFIFDSHNTAFYVWFKVNGSGTDPALAGRTGIEIDLNPLGLTYTPPEVSLILAAALSGNQVTDIHATALPPPSSYFVISTSQPQSYYVWFTVNGAGTDPMFGGIGIKVAVLSTFDINALYSAILVGVNSKYFAVPDFRGVHLRGWDPGNIWDVGTRFDYASFFPDEIGSLELDDTLAHIHSATTTIVDTGHFHGITDNGHVHDYIVPSSGGGAPLSSPSGDHQRLLGSTGSSTTGITINTATTGVTATTNIGVSPTFNLQTSGGESRGINASVAFYIKY